MAFIGTIRLTNKTTRTNMGRLQSQNSALLRIFGLDCRSLAVFRISIGVLMLIDLAIRVGDYSAHYTETGILSLASLREYLGSSSWRWSLLSLSQASWWAGLWMVVGGVAAVLLTLGLFTRIATCVCWVVWVSLHNRLPVVVNAGDTVLHCLLLWAIFLPLGVRWSIDAVRRRRRDPHADPPPEAVCSAATFAFIVQMMFLYLCAGLFKVANENWQSGISMYYVMNYDMYARPAAAWTLQHPWILKFFTWATVALEVVGSLALLSPWRTARIRLAVIASFVLFHLGIELTMTVGMFSWICIAGWLALLPLGSDPVFGIGTSCDDTDRGGRRLCRRLGICVVAVLAVGTIYWNIAGLTSIPKTLQPKWLNQAMQATGLKQTWRMFTRPPKRDGWIRVVGTTTDGQDWDLLANKKGFDWARPELPSALAPNHRWRKYYSLLINRKNDELRPPLARYLAQEFARRHSEEMLATVEIYLSEERTGPPGEPDKRKRIMLHREVLRSEGAFFDAEQPDTNFGENIHPGI